MFLSGDLRRNPAPLEAECSQCAWTSVGRVSNGGFNARVSAGRKQFARHEWAQKAAYLLGCTLEELSSSIFKHQAKGTLPRAGTSRQLSEENGTADAGTQQNTFYQCTLSFSFFGAPHTRQRHSLSFSLCSPPTHTCLLIT